MSYFTIFVIVFAVLITIGSILLSRIGLNKSVLSLKQAEILSGTGVGIATGLYIYYIISNGEIVESVLTGLIVSIAAGFAFHNLHK